MAEVGSDVWVRAVGDHCWSPAQPVEVLHTLTPPIVVQSAKDVTVEVADENGGTTTLSVSAALDNSGDLANIKLRNIDYWRFNTGDRGGVDDLVQLTFLHEPAILDVLAMRFANQCIYTFCGTILLAVNPFARLPLYTRRILEDYYSTGVLRAQGIDAPALPPHVYTTSDTAYRNMMAGMQRRAGDGSAASGVGPAGPNQSLLVSGESGAGKTETTKIIMQYLATVGRPKGASSLRRMSVGAFAVADTSGEANGSGVVASIERRVLDSNPILEAFGNAKTLRNENSSRFGKFIQLQFSSRGELVGAKIETYLLEKVRLVYQGKGERSYHAFYQLLAGADDASRTAWHLKPKGDFSYHLVDQSGCTSLREADDAHEYGITRGAMVTMGIPPADADGVFRTVAGLLHLGNLAFDGGGEEEEEKKGSKGGAGAVAAGCRFIAQCTASVNAASELLGVPRPMLESILTGKDIIAGGERYRVNFTQAKCWDSVEALVKAVYSRLFLWLVYSINRNIRAPSSSVSAFVGVLDIFGFESFARNSFEQLCINYCNETLQQHFNSYVFKLEQAEYTREDIDWASIAFPDNQDVLDMIEARRNPTGLLAMLDEQCLLATGSDDGFVRKAYDTLKSHARFSATAKHKASNQFVIVHYAGDVVYDAAGLLDKNRDTIHKEATDALGLSVLPLVRTFFHPEEWQDKERVEGGEDASVVEEEQGARGAKGAKGQGGKGGGGGGLMSETVGTQFRSQLASLMAIVKTTTPHYVRCLKPNPSQVPKAFVRLEIVHQLRCGGVLEAVRVARLGYPVRNAHDDFVRTYRCLTPKSVIAESRALQLKGDTQAAAKRLLAEFTYLEPGTVQIGKSKVFFRRAAFDELQKRRQTVVQSAAVQVQAQARRRSAEKTYIRVRTLVIMAQAFIRGYKARKLVKGIRRQNAAVRLQAFSRRCIHWLRYKRFLDAVLQLQCLKRGNTARARVLQMRRERASRAWQAAYRMHVARTAFARQKRASVTLQCWARQRKAKAMLDRYKAEAKDLANLRSSVDAMRAENKALSAEALSSRAAFERVRGLLAALTFGFVLDIPGDEEACARALEVVMALRAEEVAQACRAGVVGKGAEVEGGQELSVADLSCAPPPTPTPEQGAVVPVHTPAPTVAPESRPLVRLDVDVSPDEVTDMVVDSPCTVTVAAQAEVALAQMGQVLPSRGELLSPPGMQAHVGSPPRSPLPSWTAGSGSAHTLAHVLSASSHGAHGTAGAGVGSDAMRAGEVASLRARLAEVERSKAEVEASLTALREAVAAGKMAAPAGWKLVQVGTPDGASGASEGAGPSIEAQPFTAPITSVHAHSTPAPAPAAAPGVSLDMMEFAQRRSDKLASELERARKEAEGSRRKMERAEEGAAHAAADKRKVEERLASLQAESARNAEASGKLQAQLAAKVSEVDRLSRQLSASDASTRNKVEEGASLRAQLAGIRMQRDEALALLSEREHELSAMREKTALDSDIKMALASRLDAAIVERNELNDKTKQLRSMLERRDKDLGDVGRKHQAELDAARKALSVKDEQLTKLSKALADELANVNRLRAARVTGVGVGGVGSPIQGSPGDAARAGLGLGGLSRGLVPPPSQSPRADLGTGITPTPAPNGSSPGVAGMGMGSPLALRRVQAIAGQLGRPGAVPGGDGHSSASGARLGGVGGSLLKPGLTREASFTGGGGAPAGVPPATAVLYNRLFPTAAVPPQPPSGFTGSGQPK